MIRKYLILCLILTICVSKSIAQETDHCLTKASIIAAFTEYIGTENVSRNITSNPSGRRRIGGNYIALMKAFNVKIIISISRDNTDIIQPLYVRLFKTYLISENINQQGTSDVIEYEFKVNVSQSGWYDISIGDFSDTNNIIYDKRRINIKY